MEEDKKRYIEKLEKYIESCEEAATYSIQRFDILIISLASGGLVLSIGFVKDVIQNFHKTDTSTLKVSWFLFGITLIVNLLSQVTGYLANNLDIRTSRNLIRIERGKDPKGNQDRLLKIVTFYNVGTNILNLTSIATLIGAIIFMITFIYKNV